MQGNSPDQAIIDANLAKLGQVLDVYESKLSSSKYLAGDFYSLADLHHLTYTYYFMKTPHASLINDRPHVKAWWEDISSRPAFKKVAEGMKLGENWKFVGPFAFNSILFQQFLTICGGLFVVIYINVMG